MEDTPITIETIEAAERIVGVGYTRAERELMVDNLDGQIEAARARRALTFENHVPPASRFDPRLPGFRPPPPQAPVRGSTADPGPLPDEGRLLNLGMALEAHLGVAARRPDLAPPSARAGSK